MVCLLEKFTFFNSAGTTKISKSLRLSVYINVVRLIKFPKRFELCFYFKYSRGNKVYILGDNNNNNLNDLILNLTPENMTQHSRIG